MKSEFVVSLILFLLLTNLTAFAKNDLAPIQTSLPLEFNTGNPAPNGLPSTVISIQGKTIPIIFDTGANKSEITLSKHALKGLHVKFTGQQICANAFDGSNCQKVFIIPEVKIGTFVLKNIQGTLMPKLWGGNNKGFSDTEASKNGVIGYNLLSRFNVLLDYPHARAILYRKGFSPSQYDFSKWTAIPFSGQLKTKVILNGKSMILSWDTGSVPSIIKESLVKNMKTLACPKDKSYGRGKNCKRISTKTFVTSEGLNLPSTWLLVTNIPSQAPFDGLFGSNFYMKNLVYFDFDHKNIYVKSFN